MDSNDLKILATGVALGVGAGVAACKLLSGSSAPDLSKLELHYWNGRGLMEVPRMMLAFRGLFPNSGYADRRYTTDPPKGVEEAFSDVSNKCAANLGRLPLLTIGKDSVGQSTGVQYYVASELGLMGRTNLEAAQILEIHEHVSEMKKAFRALIPYGTTPSEELLTKWFEEGATDCSPAVADGTKRAERFFKWFSGRIEYRIGADGFAVGGQRSLADFTIYNTFAEHLKDFEATTKVSKHAKEPFCSKAHTDAAFAACPKIKAVCDSVAADPNVATWLETRSKPDGVVNLQRF